MREWSAENLVRSDRLGSDSCFVGRKPQLYRLGAALEKAKTRTGSILMLSGEAGVGKSRLALEFAEYARSSGAKVLEGRANQRVRIPFGLWKQILSSQLSQDGARQIGFTGAASSIDPRGVVPAQGFDSQVVEGESLEAAGRILVDDARVQPLVLLLDDLHAADPLSLDAFRIFARELSSLGSIVIGIYRDSEVKRSQDFGELLGDPIVRDGERILLEGFDDGEIREFVQTRTAKAADPGLLRSLVNLTAGNPRLLDLALRFNLIATQPSPLGARIRAVVRAEIESHLESLSPEVRQVLAVACVIGAEFELSLLAHVAERSWTELLNALSEAERAGFVMRTRPGRFRFRQSLIREALYEDLSGAQRARLHLQIGEVLEDLYSHDDEYMGRIAQHFFEAAMVGGMKKAVIYCRRAAELAALRGQLKDAANLYEMAISALEFQRVDDPRDRRELNLRLKELGARIERDDDSQPELIAKEQVRSEPIYSAGPALPASESSIPSHAETPGRPQEIALEQKTLAQPVSIEKVTPSREGPDSLRVSPASSPAAVIPNDAVKGAEKNPRGSRAEATSPNRTGSVFRREGEFWTLVFEGQVMRLKHSNGLLFVAQLLQHPDRDFHVAQLVALLPSARNHHAEGVYLSRSEKERLGMHDLAGREFNPLLDATAKAEYRRRIDELRDALDRAKEFNDAARAAELENELEFIGMELARAVGVRGRDRKHRTEDERARVNVTNSIRALTAKVAPEHPAFGRYLRLTIRTGRFCSYRPDPRAPTHWQF
jgi:hypothetical protein